MEQVAKWDNGMWGQTTRGAGWTHLSWPAPRQARGSAGLSDESRPASPVRSAHLPTHQPHPAPLVTSVLPKATSLFCHSLSVPHSSAGLGAPVPGPLPSALPFLSDPLTAEAWALARPSPLRAVCKEGCKHPRGRVVPWLRVL